MYSIYQIPLFISHIALLFSRSCQKWKVKPKVPHTCRRQTRMPLRLSNWITNPRVVGVEAWMQAVGAFLVYTATWVSSAPTAPASPTTNAPSPIIPPKPSLRSAPAMVFFLVWADVVTGPIHDFGHIHSLLYAGTFLTVFCVMMLSLCTAYWQILLAQVTTEKCSVFYELSTQCSCNLNTLTLSTRSSSFSLSPLLLASL